MIMTIISCGRRYINLSEVELETIAAAGNIKLYENEDKFKE